MWVCSKGIFLFIACARKFSSACTPPCRPSSPISLPSQCVSRCQWFRNISQHETECNYSFHYRDEEIERFCGVSKAWRKQFFFSGGISKFSVYLFNVGNTFLEVISSSFIVVYLFVLPLTRIPSFTLLDRVPRWHFIFIPPTVRFLVSVTMESFAQRALWT